MNTRLSGFAIALILVSVTLGAQQDTTQATTRQITHVPNYKPVPGDIYRLVIDLGARIGGGTTGGNTGGNTTHVLTYDITLQEGYTMQVPFMGEISIEGRVFPDVRQDIIRGINDRVANEYVDLKLLTPAVFNVLVYGTVSSPGLKSVDSVTRLMDAVTAAVGVAEGVADEGVADEGVADEGVADEGVAEGGSRRLMDAVTAGGGSNRRVTVQRPSRPDRTYDLLRYLHEGDTDENPFLRPEDRVFIPRRERSVVITGAVNTPGEYEILEDEQLGEILDLAGGLAATADMDRITVQRLDRRNAYTVQEIAATDYRDFDLENGDRITIASTAVTTERIVVEGALFGQPTSGGGQQQIPDGPIRTTLAFIPGMTLLGVLENLGGPTPFADSSASYIDRTSTGEQLALPDLNEIWDRRDRERDITLRAGDYIVIPSTTAEVLVAGDVAEPSRYSYVSGHTVFDYALLAGGLTRKDALERRFFRMDNLGGMHPMERTDRVRPGDTIFVASPDPVLVSGQVNAPGRLPYNSALTVGEYISLAGGIDVEESNQQRIFFLDMEGNRTRTTLTEPVDPGQIIFLERDGWGKFKKFTRDFSIIQTALTAIGVTLTLNAILNGAVLPDF